MRISDWSSDVCSSDLPGRQDRRGAGQQIGGAAPAEQAAHAAAAATTADAEAAALAPLQQDDADEGERQENVDDQEDCRHDTRCLSRRPCRGAVARLCNGYGAERSEEHTSELQSLMRISYAVFCLNKKKKKKQ